MEELQRSALTLAIIKGLQSHGSWCGETHIQKASYILKELLQVPLDYQFVLYKYGPFSFDLSGDLTAMRAQGLLKLVPHAYPYGPELRPTEASEQVRKLYPRTSTKYTDAIDFVASRLGSMGVADLERISTALYVTREQNAPRDVDARAQQIVELKPHVSLGDARAAVTAMDTYIQESQQLRPGMAVG